jgi:hypothetical protein
MPPQNLAMSQGSHGQNLHKSQGGQILSKSSGSHGMMPPENLAMSQGSHGMIYSQNMTLSQGRQNLAMSHGSQGLTYSGMLSQSSSSNSTTYDKGMMLGDSSKSMSSSIASMASTLSLNSHSQVLHHGLQIHTLLSSHEGTPKESFFSIHEAHRFWY